jgi:hypothetical protein
MNSFYFAERLKGAGTNQEQQIRYGSFYLRMGVAGKRWHLYYSFVI